MFSKFLPRESDFFDFFEQHASLIVQAAKEMLEITNAEPFTNSSAAHIKVLEHQADTIIHQCVESLHKTFITPIERDAIFQLISRMDDIIDDIDETVEYLVTYKIKQIKPEAKEMASLLFQATKGVQEAVRGLRNTGNAAHIRKQCVQINDIEHKADDVYRNALGVLFEEEQNTRDVIKWKDIYNALEEAIDRCEDVANVIEGIIMELD